MHAGAPARCGSSPRWQPSAEFRRFVAESWSMGENLVGLVRFSPIPNTRTTAQRGTSTLATVVEEKTRRRKTSNPPATIP